MTPSKRMRLLAVAAGALVALSALVACGGESKESSATTTPPAETATGVPAPAPPPPKPTVRTYTVVSGDTLWAIAERFYGDGSKYPQIARANGIADPDRINPGQVLTIP